MDLFGTLTRTPTHGTVELRYRYATDPADLWTALTDTERLARWFAPVSGDLSPGGEYSITFGDGDGERTWGTIERCEAPKGLAVTWQSPGDPQPSRVEVTLAPTVGGTELVLVHCGLTHTQDVGHAAGWEVYLRHLDAHLAGRDGEGDWWTEWTAFRDAHRATLG